ncbi:hypothetical protein DFJ74DRAFT_646093 [Hyaloraphidium curvatum]|nr:hypothetical protein DFJ74DRAFT_646093 [Hyaloraphidium curvatum]
MAEVSTTQVREPATGFPADDGLPKVFAGNLPFSATEDSLKAFFREAAEPKYANIIHRGTRSLGYGFVAFTSDADAEKAVQMMDKKEMEGRQINVELAKAKEDGVPRGRGRGVYRGTGEFRGRGTRGRGAPRGRGRGGATGAAPADGEAAAPAPAADGDAPAPAADGAPPARGRGRGRGRVARGAAAPRAPRPAPEGEPSKTTLFVANLPFTLDDAGLKQIFQEYRVTSTHVVRMKSGRSKGFGFVEVADEAEQKKVLGELKSATVNGRELTIKVAYTSQVKPEGDEGEAAEVAAESGAPPAEAQAEVQA